MPARIAHRPVTPTIIAGSGLSRQYVHGDVKPADWQPKSDLQIALRLVACLALAAGLFGLFIFVAAGLP